MSQIWKDLRLDLDEDLESKLRGLAPALSHYRVLRRSVDARKRHDLHEVITVEIFEAAEPIPEENFTVTPIPYRGLRPVIVGTGPAGLFCALRLVERGIPSVVLERGSLAEKRMLAINRYWRYGDLHPDNNVCFGEGGAGLYSDGKLITRIKSPYIPYVLKRLIQFGAPAEIEFLSNPHVGSDRIRRVIPQLRRYLVEKGCTLLFDTPMTDLILENKRVVGVRTLDGTDYRSDHVILATGHSAEDVFDILKNHEVAMEGKSFALGLRIEHPQKMINDIQYRQHADHPRLGSANYKLTHHDAISGIGVYSFCMCPGGYVLSSGTAQGGVVSNGMSNYHRNSPFANAAIVVSIDAQHRFQNDPAGLFAGLHFRRQLEMAAFQAIQKAGGSRELPVQGVIEFLEGKRGQARKSSCPSGVLATRLDQLLPEDLVTRLRSGLLEFDRKMKGFIGPEAQLHGIESRTSCPIRVTRDSNSLQSISHPGLYPAGEGAGYAGGITSAAVDGIRIAEAIVASVDATSRSESTIHEATKTTVAVDLGWDR